MSKKIPFCILNTLPFKVFKYSLFSEMLSLSSFVWHLIEKLLNCLDNNVIKVFVTLSFVRRSTSISFHHSFYFYTRLTKALFKILIQKFNKKSNINIC